MCNVSSTGNYASQNGQNFCIYPIDGHWLMLAGEICSFFFFLEKFKLLQSKILLQQLINKSAKIAETEYGKIANSWQGVYPGENCDRNRTLCKNRRP